VKKDKNSDRNGFDLSAGEYKLLYSRFLVRHPRELLNAGLMKRGDLVLDLCAGSTGRASLYAIKSGAKGVSSVDLDPHVMKLKDINDRITPFNESVSSFLSRYKDIRRYFYQDNDRNGVFDLAICQQGVNYWFSKNNIRMLSRILKKGGMFVFNTFNVEPSSTVTHKNYVINGCSYVEVWQRIGNIVYHAQFVDGHAPHYTEFEWIPENIFMDVLSLYFRDVSVIYDRATTIWRCTK
jgi:SAM-dependent methyltransferase